MYNSCISSSFPFRVSDFCYCVDRGLQLQRCGLWSVCGVSCSCSPYCFCCRLCVDRVELNNTNLVYGLRQSSLLHWSSGRRLKFGGAGSAVYSRLSGIDRVDYGFECCNGSGRKVSSFDRVGHGGTKKKRIGGLRLNDRREWKSYVAGMSEAEDLIDLLADNVVESSVVSIETEIVWPRRKKNENVCDECGRKKNMNVDSDSSRGKITKEEDFLSDKKSKVRKSGGSGTLQRMSRREELIIAKPIDVPHGRRRGRGVNLSSVNNEKLQKEGSECTSFYSVSSSGEIDSDEDFERRGELENNTHVVEQSTKITKEFRNHKDEESYDFFEETERRRNRHQGTRLEEKVAIVSHEGNIVVRDRKKSEKQLVEIAVDQPQTAARTSEKRFSASGAHNSSYNKIDISHKQFHSEDNSSLKSNRQEGRIKSVTTGSTEMLRSRREFNEESKFEGYSKSDTRLKSSQLIQSSLHQDDSSSSTNLTHVLNKQREQEFARESSQQQTGTIRIQEIDDTSEVSNMRQKEQSTSVQDLKERHSLHISTVTEAEVRSNSQQITNVSEINCTKIQETSSSKKQPEAIIKVGESSSRSVTGQSQLQISKIRQHDDCQNTELLKGSRASFGSFVESSGLTTSFGTQTTSQQGVHTLDAKVAEEEVYGRSQYKESYKKIEARRERQRLAQISRLHKGAAEESFKLSSDTTVEKVHTKAEDKRTTQSMEIITVDQPQSEGSLRIAPTTSYVHEMASQVKIENRYHLQHLQQQGHYHISEFEYDGSDARDGTMNVQHLSHISSEDALGLAEGLANSSNILTEEFIEEANIYSGASEVQDGKLQKSKTDNEDSKKQALVKYVSAEVEFESPPLSSEGSEAKEHSDEKWDVALSSVEPPADFKTPEVSPQAGSTSGKRTGRSLWNVIGDVTGARWIFRGEGHTSPSKSRKRSSSNESTRSDASGHEQDTPASKEAEKRSPIYKYASPSIKVKQEKEHTKSQQAGSNAEEVKDEYSMSGSSPTLRLSGSGSAALGDTLTFDKANQSSSVPEVSNLAPISSPGLLGTSTSLPSLPSRRLSRSPVIKSPSLRARDGQTESSSAEQIDQQSSPLKPISSGREMSFLATYRSPGLLQSSPSLHSRLSGRSPGIGSTSLRALDDRNASSSVELSDEQPSPLGPTEISEPEEQAREGTRRKFQRSMQVSRDIFEEWEEALNRETEQHKIDDIFMREALVEAKKAADNWEVPVGAVLVKDGKIVARGCNLVEELRDSTAHAEMICIRDASTALRTWRLSETTLYVTLEPCAMCAGAILQARVTTLVWGAPNKLLGADGSWIRLFPEDGERDNTPELSGKPPAPVHPFHPKMNIRRGVLATECAQAMQQFFHLRRQDKNKSETSSPPPSCLPTPRNPAKLITKVHGLFGSSTRL